MRAPVSITLSDHRAVYDAKCGRPQGGWSNADNSLQYSQPTYLRELFTIHLTRPNLTILCLSDPLSHFSSHVLQPCHIRSVTALRLWSDLPPELCTSSVVSPSLKITHQWERMRTPFPYIFSPDSVY